MAPTTKKSLMKDFRASFRRKKVEPTPKIDKVKELEDEEMAKLAELKENIGEKLPIRYKDSDLLAFIRARSLNVKEAEKLMKLDVNLRHFLQVEDLVKNHELSELNRKYSVSGVLGFDKEGSMIRVLNIGYSDIKGYIHSVSTIDNFKFFILYLERDRQRQEEENRRTGRKKNQITYIINLENLGLGKVMYKPAIDTGIVALKLLQDHFHDTVKMVYVINAPSFYSTLFKFFKPVIQDDLHKRIKVFDDGDSWKVELLKHIDADVLPVCFGGNRVDSDNDETCKSLISWGGTIPESYYFTEFLNPTDPEVLCATIPAGSAINYRLYISEVGSKLMWQIQAKENDIGIGLFLDESPASVEEGKQKKKAKEEDLSKLVQLTKEEDLSKLVQLTPVTRSQCHICPEIGSTLSWFTGTVVLHLDNTYSWMSSKEVLLKIFVKPSK